MTLKTFIKPNLRELKQSLLTSNKNSESTESLIADYENFLFLIKKYPTLKAVPTKAIDTIWHHHLSNEELYSKDCISYFGHIIHHKQATSKSAILELKKNYNLTNKLWFSTFNTYLGDIEQMAICGVDGGDNGGDNGGDDY